MNPMIVNNRFFHRFCALVLSAALLCTGCSFGKKKNPNEIEKMVLGVDVAKYQGTIDWQKVSNAGVSFAMVRLGYRGKLDGVIVEDSNARYNLQEAGKQNILLGGYFFSTAVSEEEAIEEARWVADLVAGYPITYPIAYDCERFRDEDSRQYSLSKAERTKIAMAFLKEIEKLGYEGMFYASKNDMEGNSQWDVSKIQKKYKIWVAQYPETPYPGTPESSYSGKHQMWQYTHIGTVPGVEQAVDLNVAYFSYSEVTPPKSDITPEEVGPDVEALMEFHAVQETVTAKEETRLRDRPSQDEDSLILYTLKNGELAQRVAVSDSGWSKVLFNGMTCYAVTSYLTTDMNYTPPPQYEPETDDGVETRFEAVNEKVTAKEKVNLRALPSVEHEDAKVVAVLKNGDIAVRTGINRDLGWSRVEYQGKVLYCVSSMIKTVE